MASQPVGYGCTGSLAGVITIQHQHNLLKPLGQSSLWGGIEGDSHERHYRTNTRLIDLQAVEKAFDNHHGGICGRRRSMEIKQYLGFGKPRGESVPRLCSVKRPATVGNQLSLRVVNRDNQAAAEQSGPWIETYSKIDCGLVGDASSCQIRMGAVNTAEAEPKRQRFPCFFRNQFLRVGRCRINGYRHVLEFVCGITQSAGFHCCDKVQDSSTSPTGETMKDVPSQVYMEGVGSLAAVDRTAPTILVFATPSQLNPILA